MRDAYRAWWAYLTALEAHDGPGAAQAMADYLDALEAASQAPITLAGIRVA